VTVELSAEVFDLDELRQPAVAAGGGELVRSLPQLGRDRSVAEERVEIVLARVRQDLPRLDVRDAVLGDGEAPALRLLTELDVVVTGAREVLEDVPVALVRDHPKIDGEPVVRHGRRLRRPSRGHLRNPIAAAERLDERSPVGRRRDEIDVVDRLAPSAHAPRLGHGDGRWVRGELLRDAAHRR
jgi:hypothetical protein